ncbi:MAG: hypothetical protein HOV66_27850 [Streptomycetaceae bacterium]|nr:hypothetical protein [Nocardioidaceae bacterium]NUS58633.1 hypothetical protein [Streptomycetaceae bacterium]
MTRALHRVEDYIADHARAVAVVLILASTWGRLPGTVIVDVPVPLAAGAFIAVILAAIAVVAAEFYKVNILAGDWDQVVDQADQGARAADTLGELTRTVHALAGEVARLRAAPRPRPAPGPRTQPATVVLAGQADEWRTKFDFSGGQR